MWHFELEIEIWKSSWRGQKPSPTSKTLQLYSILPARFALLLFASWVNIAVWAAGLWRFKKTVGSLWVTHHFILKMSSNRMKPPWNWWKTAQFHRHPSVRRRSFRGAWLFRSWPRRHEVRLLVTQQPKPVRWRRLPILIILYVSNP